MATRPMMHETRSDAELDRFVIARAAVRSKRIAIGRVQRDILAAAARGPITVRDGFRRIACTSLDDTVDKFATLLAAGLIEISPEGWRATGRTGRTR